MGYKKGQSGNPKGKPIGSKDKRTELRLLLKPQSENLVNKLIDMALDGDMTAMKLCIDRLMPAYRTVDEPIKIKSFTGTSLEKMNAINEAVRVGGISASEANALGSLLINEVKIMEIDILEKRIIALEESA